MSLLLPAPGDTELLGAALAAALPLAPKLGAVLYLQGELGAGKTTCVRSLLRALGVTGLVRSPTYTLVETYETAALSCVHVDLYRLAAASEASGAESEALGADGEAEGLGLRDLGAPGTLLMVEWPEKGGGAVPRADVTLSLSYEGQARRAQLRPLTELGRTWVRNLGDDTRLAPYVSNIT